jgi:hypothetical protein
MGIEVNRIEVLNIEADDGGDRAPTRSDVTRHSPRLPDSRSPSPHLRLTPFAKLEEQGLGERSDRLAHLAVTLRGVGLTPIRVALRIVNPISVTILFLERVHLTPASVQLEGTLQLSYFKSGERYLRYDVGRKATT